MYYFTREGHIAFEIEKEWGVSRFRNKALRRLILLEFQSTTYPRDLSFGCLILANSPIPKVGRNDLFYEQWPSYLSRRWPIISQTKGIRGCFLKINL